MNENLSTPWQTSEFWKNPQNWIYIGVAGIVVIGLVVILSSYGGSKTEAEIKADVLKTLMQSEPAPVSAEERAAVLKSLQSGASPKVSADDKAKVLEALRSGETQ